MKPDPIRFVTANYHQLQGLRLVPLGLVLIFQASLDPLGLSSSPRLLVGGRSLRLVGLAVGLGWVLAVTAPLYYYYRYGSVQPVDRRSRNRWITVAVIGFFVLGRVDRYLQWPVALQHLLVSISLFITVWHDGRVRRHYLAPAVVWLVVSCLPALHDSKSDRKMIGLGLGGLTLIVCGIGDHLLLTHTLTKPRRTDDASQTATV